MKCEKSLCLAALRLPTWKKGVWGWECTGCEHSVLSARDSGEGRRVIPPVNGNCLVTITTQERPCRSPIRELPQGSKPILLPASTPVTLLRHRHAQTPHFSCCFHLPLFFLTKTTYIKILQGTGACRVRRCREVPKTSYSNSCQHHLSPLLINEHCFYYS